MADDVDEREARLDRLLDEELAFDATTDSGTSSHLSMALVAAGNLGASAEELSAFSRRYAKRLSPRREGGRAVTPLTFSSALGRPGTYGAFVDHFTREIDVHGVDDVVSRTLDRLRPGIHGGAYHGVLRLAYALERPTAQRVASGLAYLAEVHRPLGAEAWKEGSRGPEEAFALLYQRREEFAVVGAEGLIGDRMVEAAASPVFVEVVDSVVINDSTLDCLHAIAVTLFAITLDFVALHGVTGVEALRRVRDRISDPRLVDREALRSLCAAYVVCGCPALPETAPTARRSVPAELARAALVSGDEHDLKIADTALKLAGRPCGPLVLEAAGRYVRGTTSPRAVADRSGDGQ